MITITAAYDPLELDLDQIQAADYSAELRRLVRAVEGQSAEELEAQVYKRFKFDLCGRCQREFLREPLPRRPAARPTDRDDEARVTGE